MGKIVVRVDDRLIHGQTIVAWCPTLAIQEIIAIDDESAKNPMLKSIMTMSVPPLYKTHIVTTGQPAARAMSMILQILAACISPRDPPWAVKS